MTDTPSRQEIVAQERELVRSLYEPGHPVRTALDWEATADTVPVNATVLVDELARVVVALGARTTEADLIWIDELAALTKVRDAADAYIGQYDKEDEQGNIDRWNALHDALVDADPETS